MWEKKELSVTPQAGSNEAFGWASSSENCWVLHLAVKICLLFFPEALVSPVPCTAGFFAKDEEPRCQSFLSALAGKLFYLFSKKAFCIWWIFSFLLWEVASSFPKNILHLLFKQGALEELWSVKSGGGEMRMGVLWNLLFDTLMWTGVLAVCKQKSQFAGLGSVVGCGEEKLAGNQELRSFKHLISLYCKRYWPFWTQPPSGSLSNALNVPRLVMVGSLPFWDARGTLERKDQLICSSVNETVCNTKDCVAMGALVQRTEIPVEESTKIGPCTVGWVWVHRGKSGGY